TTTSATPPSPSSSRCKGSPPPPRPKPPSSCCCRRAPTPTSFPAPAVPPASGWPSRSKSISEPLHLPGLSAGPDTKQPQPCETDEPLGSSVSFFLSVSPATP